jgi:hypothetical protein
LAIQSGRARAANTQTTEEDTHTRTGFDIDMQKRMTAAAAAAGVQTAVCVVLLVMLQTTTLEGKRGSKWAVDIGCTHVWLPISGSHDDSPNALLLLLLFTHSHRPNIPLNQPLAFLLQPAALTPRSRSPLRTTAIVFSSSSSTSSSSPPPSLWRRPRPPAMISHHRERVLRRAGAGEGDEEGEMEEAACPCSDMGTGTGLGQAGPLTELCGVGDVVVLVLPGAWSDGMGGGVCVFPFWFVRAR